METLQTDIKLEQLCETDGLDLVNELYWNQNGFIFVLGSTKSPSEPGLFQLYLLQQKDKNFSTVKIETIRRENANHFEWDPLQRFFIVGNTDTSALS